MTDIELNCPIAGCNWKSQKLPVALADVLNTALTMHKDSDHSQPQAPTAPTPSLKLKSPSINAGSSPDQWSSFQRQWSMYKTGMNIPTSMCSTALFHCCHEDLMNDLMRDLQQDVSAMAESDLLAAIKRLAVKEESTLVHRIKLSKMTQAPGTPIRTFLAALRGQASLCRYTAQCKEQGCNHTYDYSNEIIKDNLIRGIADPEILSDLLGDPKTDRTLEETVCFIVQKEQGKATRAAVGDTTSTMSQYHPRARTHQPTPPTRENNQCWACGESQHGAGNDRNSRAKHCSAWSSTCNKCSVKGHFSSNCSKCTSCGKWGHRDIKSRWCPQNPRSKTKSKGNSSTLQTEDDETAALFSQLCATESLASTPRSLRPVEHHVYEDKWVARPSKPHPVITVKLAVSPEDHEKLGHPIRSSNPTPIDIPMVADSGCQSSIIPMRSALAMGIARDDIFPVKLTMRGAIEEDLGVAGGIIVKVSAADVTGAQRSTKQLMYVSNKIGKAFLCREALAALGAIPHDFPSIPISWPEASLASAADQNSKCLCPQRTASPPSKPTELPPGIEPNANALKDWLLSYYASSAFNTCEHQPLPMMKCEPLELHVDPTAKPVAVHKPALVPVHWQDKVHQDLERDVRIGVLEKVNPNTPVTWCSRMVVTAKADGSPRRTVDLQPQNRHSVRQTHQVESPFHLADRVPQGTLKTVTDAWNGCHSVPIREEDRHITTFITPWGRYRYKVAPQGFLASGDAYNQRFDAIISHITNKVKCVDDTCLWADTLEASFFQTVEWLDLCARNGITLNPKKFQFAQNTVTFAGLQITPTSVTPSEKFLDSISKFPTPRDITGARAWFGLVNQGAYAFSMAQCMQPFRHLLKPKTKFEWTPALDAVFAESKQRIVEEIKEGVRLFEPSRPTCLITDWSITGIGFFMMQKYCRCASRTPICCKGGWKLCLVGSRFTHNAESRYAPIEGEALAVVYALHQTRYYTTGCQDLTVATDHKPLVGILNDRSLSEIENQRLLNLKEKTLAYSFKIIHVSGKKNLGADAASRYPPSTDRSRQVNESDEVTLAEDDSILASTAYSLYSISNVITWDMVKEATSSDQSLQCLERMIHEGFPEDCRQLSTDLRPYHRISGSLSVLDGVILTGNRIIVPASLRQNIAEALHAAHQGVNAMCARAADTVYWPNITTDIQRVRDHCAHCHRIAKSNALQPPSDPSPPEYPFQKVACDYFTYNNHDYVVVVDRYSNWPMVFHSERGADGLVKRLREVFVTFGVAEELTSDGGPQFTAGKTQEFLKSWGVSHRLTSVANPHGNCRAEIAVKTVKRMLMDNTSATGSINIDKFQKAMLVYRNSIDPETKVSPALIVFGRPIRDPIPVPMGRYCPHPTWSETLEHRERALAKRHSREHEKWTEHSRTLPALQVGDHVYVQNLVGNHPKRWERTGTVVEVKQFHQYVVKIDGSGRLTLRNRQHLRKFTPFKSVPGSDYIESFIPPMRETNDATSNADIPNEPSQEGSSDQVGLPNNNPQLAEAPESSDNTRGNVPIRPKSPHTPPFRSPYATSVEADSPPTPPFLSPMSSPPSLPQNVATNKLPLAIRRLQSYNASGLSETAPTRRERGRRDRS